MKTLKKQLVLITVLLMTLTSFAQKDEMKAIGKAISKSNFTEAMASITKVDGMLSSLDDKTKAKFYALKAKALNGLGKSLEAGKVISTLMAFEKGTGKIKYSKEMQPIFQKLVSSLQDKSKKDYENKNWNLAKISLAQVYDLNPQDTAFLYYAASAAQQGKDLDTALKHYQTLSKVGFTGAATNYFAINKASGQRKYFTSEKNMNVMMKSGLYSDAKTEVLASKKGDIIQRMASIYIEKGDNDKAIAAIKTVRAEDPKNIDLIMTEASIEMKLGHKSKFANLMKEAITLDPNNAVLHYNVGVVNQQQGDMNAAKIAYEKAIELDSNYVNAYNNLGAVILNKNTQLEEELNSVSMSDNAGYTAIRNKQLAMFKEVLPVYEKLHAIDAKDKDVVRMLMNLYSNLEKDDKYKAIKAVYDGM